MKEVSCHLHYQVYEDMEELQDSDQQLLKAAKDVLLKAYAPYSAFKVGAAVKLANGEIITGNNQENAAYPSGLCAERVALFYASSQYPDTPVTALAVTASSLDFDLAFPVTPCGACRQVIAETEIRFEKKAIRVIMQGDSGEIIVMEGVNNLLPLMFHAEELKKYQNGTDLD